MNRNNPAVQRKWYLAHRAETILRSMKWKKDNPEALRKARRKAKGVKNPTGEIRTGVCPCCGKAGRLYLDHDHLTGEIRGWLCGRCNIALGWWEKILTEGLDLKFKQYLNRILNP